MPDEALARLLALAIPVEIEVVPLIDAAGRWAAEPVVARRTQPARCLSAMDGYAVRYNDVPGPWRVAGESRAGRPFGDAIGRGEAVRISTGAAVPSGADTIIVQEDVIRRREIIMLTGDGAASQGAHCRNAASDFASGQCLIERGQRLSAARVALAALGGHATLAVRRRIRIAIISTGDELVAPGTDAGFDRLPASNAVMLAALLAALPVEIEDLGIVPDDRALLAATFKRAAGFDVMLSTGGASVGDHDLVHPALVDAGATIDFWKIAMRPGKPLMAGRLGNAVAIGLPGNPVSAFVTATLFIKPLIAYLSGGTNPTLPMMRARLACHMPAVGVRTDYVRARWVGGHLMPLSGDSGMLVPLADADALIVRAAGAPPALSGDEVEIIHLA